MLTSITNTKSKTAAAIVLMLPFLLFTACDRSAPRSDNPDVRRWIRQDDFVYAAYRGDLAEMKALFAEGVDVNASTGGGGHETDPALIVAAGEGHIEVVKFLLDNGADVNIKGTNGIDTALMSAAGGGHKEIVKLLIDKGADVNAIGSKGRTALAIAVDKNHSEIIEMLKRAGARK